MIELEDPERIEWRQGRRSFLFMLGAATGGLFLPELPKILIPDPIIPGKTILLTPTWVTHEVAKYFLNSVRALSKFNQSYDDQFRMLRA